MNGLFSDTNFAHSLLGLLSCIPGFVGSTASAIDGLVYAVVDKDYSMMALCFMDAASFGIGKAGSKLLKAKKYTNTAETLINASHLMSNAASFGMCADAMMATGFSMYDKYYIQGQSADSNTKWEVLSLGMSALGCVISGRGISKSTKSMSNMLQQEGFTNALKGEVMEMAGKAQKTSAIVESSGSGMRMNLQFFGGGNSMDLEMEQMPSLLPQTYTADLSNVTGKGADARNRAIMAIIKEDFPDLKLTFIPEYSPFIRTGVAQRNTGTQIGKRMFSSRAELRDTIIHEELHHRWWKRGIIDHHPMNSAKEELFYKTIAEYKKMRGWD